MITFLAMICRFNFLPFFILALNSQRTPRSPYSDLIEIVPKLPSGR
jgi:hypothetical protein